MRARITAAELYHLFLPERCYTLDVVPALARIRASDPWATFRLLTSVFQAPTILVYLYISHAFIPGIRTQNPPQLRQIVNM